MLAMVPAALAADRTTTPSKKSRPLPSAGEFFRFADPITETPVVRLTNPASTSVLPRSTNRFVSLRDRFLVFSSDRTGRATPFSLDLRTGALNEIARTADLVPQSLCLDTQERHLYFIDESALKEVSLSNKNIRTLKDDVSGFHPGASPGEFVVVRRGRLERLNSPGAPLAEDVASECLVRPGGTGCLFSRDSAGGREFWYVPFNGGTGAQPKLLARGQIYDAFWSDDGRWLLFLRDVPTPNAVLSEIHEVSPETGLEQRVTPTSQFAAFAPNKDGSMFVGASGSKAQPTVILLLRSAQRELTLCEHRASHPGLVSPVFSPDSRRVYFQSDHQGKSAIYSVNVELLVEPT